MTSYLFSTVFRESQGGWQEGKGFGETERTNRHCRPHQSGPDLLRKFIAPYKNTCLDWKPKVHVTLLCFVQVLFNLANQYANNDMYTEALNTYQVIVKNKMFSNAGKQISSMF